MTAPDAYQHARVVLAAIIPNRRDLLDQALRQLQAAHFIEPTHATLFQLLERYIEITQAVMPRAALGDILRGHADPAKVLLYQELYDTFAYAQVADPDFTWSVQQLRELDAERRTLEALSEGAEILRNGVRDKRGNEIRGHQDARAQVQARFAELDRALSAQDAPKGDMRAEQHDMLDDYATRKRMRESGMSRGIDFGIPVIDHLIGGMQPGELALIAGHSSDGKSTCCAQLGWSAAIEQGRNVVILTTETTRAQFRRKIIARHSVLSQWNLPEGINTRDLRNGTVPSEHEPALQAIVADLTQNQSYGRLYIAQVPRGASISTCEAQLYRIQRQFNIELAVFDYFALLRAEERRDSDRESLGSILKAGKQLTTTFDHGRGLVVASPWQVNRKAKEYADLHGIYLPEHMSETAEATNSPDIIASILSNLDIDQRIRDVKMQILKNRDGETAKQTPLTVRVDYGTSAFGQAQASRTANSLNAMTGGVPANLGGLLPGAGGALASLTQLLPQ